MTTIRILLEVASTDVRTPKELADIAARRLTSCLGIDQCVQEPVKGSVLPDEYESDIRAEARSEGFNEGYEDGKDDGYDDGYSAGVVADEAGV